MYKFIKVKSKERLNFFEHHLINKTIGELSINALIIGYCFRCEHKIFFLNMIKKKIRKGVGTYTSIVLLMVIFIVLVLIVQS